MAPVAKRADRVVVLDEKGARVHLLAERHALAGEVEVGGQRDIDAGGVAENPELRAQPGIEVEQLVLAVPGVQTYVEVEQALVAEPCKQAGDLVAEDLVRG